jgi:hypothetical protein
MIPEFANPSEEFKRRNPHIFPKDMHFGNVMCFDPNPPREHEPTKADLKLEKQLQDQIAGHLEINGTVVIRSRMDRKTTTRVGTPDLLFALKGRAIAIEVKRPGHKPSKEQLEMMRQMTANGWRCFVIDDYDEAVKTINKLFLEFTVDATAS